ncbi:MULTISPECIES: phytanoyl-CoA dioxygenase family protein [Legionella]|uniref:Phytanoyl-CoA dioxygenase family protein n=1 Tax=Legionella resiliens TaxID=2905958 RepID=A0ABS8WZT9_9GAMM|nr:MULTISPECIES: phytanoyl-CoA dioxygenase family protein [unclassified Legionella]MCE0722860.1 phytanoyl-CoA dioxygenase family protein [Legionella sp. 9fVS26]MCE3532013.1 phytanoyl-CoA dioxygenase family protein [Legionella sp. 8cVS16]QLZ68131.1 phytanoyl-CoA dioxygenase family protein [Legionella sp. PC1000]
MNYQLSEAQQSFWQKQGFVLLQDFLLITLKHHLQTWCDELTSWPETPGKWMKYFEKNAQGGRQLCRVENFIDYHKGMYEVANGSRTLNLVSSLMGEQASIFKEKINYKFPGGGGFKPHQDAPAFISFNQRFHITMMVAIDDCTLENGCLHVVKGGANKPVILPQEADGSIKTEIAETFQWTPIECKTGDVILFDSYLPHYSEANRSNKPRRAIFITFSRLSEGGAKREAYYQDKREKFPPDCERDPNKDYSAGAAIYNVANPISEMMQ